MMDDADWSSDADRGASGCEGIVWRRLLIRPVAKGMLNDSK